MNPQKGFSKLADRPMATAIAILLASSGLITIFGLGLTHDALEAFVPYWFVVLLSCSYSVAGLLLLAGMMFNRADAEGAGCIMGIAGVVVRLIAVVVSYGLTPAVLSTTLLYIAIGWAFAERFRQIVQHQQIVRVNATVDVGVADDRSMD